ncbi:UDP-glucose 4-epimerase [Allocatelliglobosispora scoriae]|uniref:UDP-glucose 4-epimerase n=1 Tax=Allocatelliglobosispora scoriae TaxID=643052 RepID=A0A841BXH0_9ACTN|nr:NAD-dependent epimerase/dehydratase family protein [Allocatelliglobosispora scoriae]MBB5871462.1 UDP-glucose 4-epimerase [Allocatelliglobosispora scoriae]
MTATPEVVFVTGVSRFLGARLAGRIAAHPGVKRVIGLDVHPVPEPLAADLHRVELVTADMRTLADIIADSKAQAVVHLAVVSAPEPGGRSAMKDQNVIGTMQLLGACQQVPTLRTLVVRSSTAAYGASFRDPAVFTEDAEPREAPRGGFGKDILDIEGYVRGFRRRRPDVTATVLRFAPFIGSGTETALLRYFSRPIVPTVLGRDPRLQFVHVDDALEILTRSVLEQHPGTYNVAGPGVLTLSQAIRRAGRLAAPIVEPGLIAASVVGRGVISKDQVDLFVHGRVVDVSKLTREFGFTPRPTAEAFRAFVKTHETGAAFTPERIAAVEQTLLDMIASVRSRATTGGGA